MSLHSLGVGLFAFAMAIGGYRFGSGGPFPPIPCAILAPVALFGDRLHCGDRGDDFRDTRTALEGVGRQVVCSCLHYSRSRSHVAGYLAGTRESIRRASVRQS